MAKAGSHEASGPAVGPLAGTRLNRTLAGCRCFPAGTGVRMADGTTESAEDVKIGDKVLATDPKTGKTTASEVTTTIVTDSDEKFTDLTISTREGEEHLVATSEHPFWSVTEKDWIEAGKLKPGAALRTPDGHTVEVVHSRQYEDSARTYNLTTKGLHTYYVLAGLTPILVHNSN